jgi:acetylornithine deacetylase/succinyl-diaminopimelate desuccinylase-like protein
VHGDLPVRIIWVLEGEEEIGSPHLHQFLMDHSEELKGDGCIWEFGGHTWEHVPNLTLGLKGMLSVELVATGANRDLHHGPIKARAEPVSRCA